MEELNHSRIITKLLLPMESITVEAKLRCSCKFNLLITILFQIPLRPMIRYTVNYQSNQNQKLPAVWWRSVQEGSVRLSVDHNFQLISRGRCQLFRFPINLQKFQSWTSKFQTFDGKTFPDLGFISFDGKNYEESGVRSPESQAKQREVYDFDFKIKKLKKIGGATK